MEWARGGSFRKRGTNKEESDGEREAKCSERCVCTLKWLTLQRTHYGIYILQTKAYTHAVVALIQHLDGRLYARARALSHLGTDRKYFQIRH